VYLGIDLVQRGELFSRSRADLVRLLGDLRVIFQFLDEFSHPELLLLLGLDELFCVVLHLLFLCRNLKRMGVTPNTSAQTNGKKHTETYGGDFFMDALQLFGDLLTGVGQLLNLLPLFVKLFLPGSDLFFNFLGLLFCLGQLGLDAFLVPEMSLG